MTTKTPTNDSHTSKIVWIDISNFEAICFNLTREFLSFDQPIPEFTTRSVGVLESCLNTPLQQFDGKDLYPSLIDKAAILFYLLIKNHPFLNGNKRMAVTSLLVVLYLNNMWLNAKSIEIYKLAKSIAQSDRKNKDKDLKKINSFIKNNLIKRRR